MPKDARADHGFGDFDRGPIRAVLLTNVEKAAEHARIAESALEQGEAAGGTNGTVLAYQKAQIHATLAVAYAGMVDSAERSLAVARPGDAFDPWRDAKDKGFIERVRPRVLVKINDGEIEDVSMASDVDIDVLILGAGGAGDEDMYRLSREGDPEEAAEVHEAFQTSGGLRA